MPHGCHAAQLALLHLRVAEVKLGLRGPPRCAGYFTSRPTSKGYIRSSTSFLQVSGLIQLCTLNAVAMNPFLCMIAHDTCSNPAVTQPA